MAWGSARQVGMSLCDVMCSVRRTNLSGYAVDCSHCRLCGKDPLVQRGLNTGDLWWRDSTGLLSWSSRWQGYGGQGSPQLARRRGATSRSANCDSGGLRDHFRWQTHRSK